MALFTYITIDQHESRAEAVPLGLFAIMTVFFIFITMVFVAIAIFLPEWMGITGKKAKEIIADHSAIDNKSDLTKINPSSAEFSFLNSIQSHNQKLASENNLNPQSTSNRSPDDTH